MNIRILQSDDAYRFHMFRLQGSNEFSWAFDPTYEEEQQQSLDAIMQRITPKGNPPEQLSLEYFNQMKS